VALRDPPSEFEKQAVQVLALLDRQLPWREKSDYMIDELALALRQAILLTL
jgi:hypothetical protein